MDAPNPSATPTFASRTPLHVGAVGLKVRDLDRLTNYYRDVLGLMVLDRSKDGAKLGAGGVALVHLEHRPDAKPDDTRTAGLYHTAFLVPTRADLARWILHVARNKRRSPAPPTTRSARRSISTIPRATASRSITTGRRKAGSGPATR